MDTSILFLIFPALMVFAALYDVLSWRITNGLCLLLAATFLPAAWVAGFSPEAVAAHLACAVVMLAAGFALFAAGWVGGGDAKLFAAAALWFGWADVGAFAAATAIAGGAVGLAVLTIRAVQWRYLAGTSMAALGRIEIPYGVALALGTLVAFPDSIWAVSLPL